MNAAVSSSLRQEARTPSDILDRAGTPFEMAGFIKWFDVAKGFGFIIPDDVTMPDVLLHVTCLRRDGFPTAYEGDLAVRARERPMGGGGDHEGEGDCNESQPPAKQPFVRPARGFH